MKNTPIKQIHTILLLFCFVYSQAQEQTYAERLGYPRGAKVLILHVDDAGMSEESNLGVQEALEKGIATSCSIMAPCLATPAFIEYLKAHPATDAGLHITLNAEWNNIKWQPIADKRLVPGLLDAQGNMWQNVADVIRHATPAEVEIEMRAQLKKILDLGWNPTHFDAHLGTIFASPSFIQRYIKIAIENKIPPLFPAGNLSLVRRQWDLADAQVQMIHTVGSMIWNAGLPVIDDLDNESNDWKIPADIAGDSAKLNSFKTNHYLTAIRSLKPGITVLIMHCTIQSASFDKISASGPSRYGDLLAALDPVLKNEIDKQHIILASWKDLSERRSKIK